MEATTAFWLAAGVVLLFAGGEALVSGAVRLAHRVGVTPLVIGVTVVAFGTSAPELVVSTLAASRGQVRIGKEPGRLVPAGARFTLRRSRPCSIRRSSTTPTPSAPTAVPYLHFGAGMHRCYGAPINGVTLPELAAALLRRPPIRRAGWLRGRIHPDGPFPDRLEVRFAP